MSARIAGLVSKQVEQLVSNKVEKRDVNRKEKSESTTTPSGERVSISEAARDVAAAKSRVSLLPDVRSERVEELRDAVANGSYDVDSHAVADRLLRETLLDLLL
ncbi:MAG: flagellar biosynthesis anti-sigma factor FlgM [Nitrospirae bacterium]|nr:flagellar biosynthesis anti-sigma factor FlgM [Nitrospirota bacterium]